MDHVIKQRLSMLVWNQLILHSNKTDNQLVHSITEYYLREKLTGHCMQCLLGPGCEPVDGNIVD